MSTITETIAAGEVRRYFVAGHFMRLQAGDDLTVTFFRNGEMIGKYERATSGFAAKVPQGFDRFDLQNTGSMAANVRVFLGEESGIDIQFAGLTGTVSVINGELSRVYSGSCFIGRPAVLAGAGLISHAQLWNPLANTKNLIVSKLQLMSSAPGELHMRVASTALATLSTERTNKKFGAAAPSGEIRIEQRAAYLGSLIGSAGISAAWESPEYPFSEPVVIPPGYGFVVCPAAANQDVFATFQWFEEAV